MAVAKRARIFAAVVAAAWCFFAACGEPDTPTLVDLAWMAGHWAATVGDVSMEEAWIGPQGGVMLGVHRNVRVGGTAFFEYLRIEDRGGQVVYIASPMGRGATEFTLVLVENRRVVFENPAHDFPQRIIYRREGDTLSARAEGLVDGQSRADEWEWRLK